MALIGANLKLEEFAAWCFAGDGQRCGVLGRGLSRLAEVGEASLVVREVLPKFSRLAKRFRFREKGS